MRTMLVVAFLLGLALPIANAQTQSQKPVLCYKIDNLLENLQKDYKEQPVWSGKSDTGNSVYMLFENPETKLWTVIQFNEKTGCVLGYGDISNVNKHTKSGSTL